MQNIHFAPSLIIRINAAMRKKKDLFYRYEISQRDRRGMCYNQKNCAPLKCNVFYVYYITQHVNRYIVLNPYSLSQSAQMSHISV